MGWLNVKSFSCIPASGTEPDLKEVACKYLIVKGERQHRTSFRTSLCVRMNAGTVDDLSRLMSAIDMSPQVISLRLWNQKAVRQMATAADVHICLLLDNESLVPEEPRTKN